jgi:succinoglycan biosynthesis protein ExoM
VRFHIDLVLPGLRFDEGRGLTGGEDTDFFARAHTADFHIAQIGCAITREAVHPERLTYRGQMYRQFWEAACGVRRLADERGWLTAALARVPSILGYLLLCVLLLAASVPAGIAGPRHFANLALKGGKRIAKAIGRAAALAGHAPQPYRTIHGA